MSLSEIISTTTAATRSEPVLQRATFRTSRLLDFASEKELVAQTGHRREQWALVVLKELIDNSIDACEEAGIAPVVEVTVDDAGITIADNGPGLPAETVKDVLDFSVRVSSREAYVSPTRGAQGNALKTIVVMPFVLDGHSGQVEIEARGIRHVINFEVDHVRQEPVVQHQPTASAVEVGTVVRVPWRWDEEPNSPRSIQAVRPRFLQIAGDYTWHNPHLSLVLGWFGERVSVEATDMAWRKWKPSDPTSPHWYTPAHLERLIGAYVSHDADNGRSGNNARVGDKPVRRLVVPFFEAGAGASGGAQHG
jgi:Histidine kinase-, DNA gyrase B-, and HSP90-like ATPase